MEDAGSVVSSSSCYLTGGARQRHPTLELSQDLLLQHLQPPLPAAATAGSRSARLGSFPVDQVVVDAHQRLIVSLIARRQWLSGRRFRPPMQCCTWNQFISSESRREEETRLCSVVQLVQFGLNAVDGLLDLWLSSVGEVPSS